MNKNGGRSTARSTPWGSPSPLVKPQGGGTGESATCNSKLGNSKVDKLPVTTNDGKPPEALRGLRKIRFGSWNVGSLKGKCMELCEVLLKRRVDVCCVQEARWKGAGTRMLHGYDGAKYKLLWQGGVRGLNGVGVLLSEEFIDKVVSVVRVNERLMMVKLVVGRNLLNVISLYAPQTGRCQEEKDLFWNSVYDLMENVSKDEMVVIGGDLNGHVGKESDGYKGVHGGFGYGKRNVEGEQVLEFCDSHELIVCGTQFLKEESKLISYSSGGRNTTVDYLLIRNEQRRYLRDAKAFPGMDVVSQHRLIVIDMLVKNNVKGNRKKFVRRRKVWRLKEKDVLREFRENLVLSGTEGNVETVWQNIKNSLMKATEKTCGWTKRNPKHRETWWWNGDVKEKVNDKRQKYHAWYKAKGTPYETKLLNEYLKAKREAKKAVAHAKQKERQSLANMLETEEGKKKVFRIAKQMRDERRDVLSINCLRSGNGKVLMEPERVKNRWKEYMERLLNVENEWNGLVDNAIYEGPEKHITKVEIKNAINLLKCGKAGGPTGLVGDIFKAAGDVCVTSMTVLCNKVFWEGVVPSDWELSTLVPLFKGKGDPMECGSYRAIKLLEHGMKVYERVLEKRLRDVVVISDMQYGFMPGKGTTAPIFIVRQMQEKFLEKRQTLYFAFVDLEKAFDRVPRKVVSWALRKMGVGEWMVRAVMAMYQRCRTVVRTMHGNSADFEVKVGVHQGSVLSPLLFVIVLEALTCDIRAGLPFELLYADDLVLMADSVDLLHDKIVRWRECLESKGLKVNLKKTKIMLSRRNKGAVEKVGRWPCSVCGKGVGRNSIQCSACLSWVHKRCSGIKSSLKPDVCGFVCGVCLGVCGDGADGSLEHLSLKGGEALECVDRFCYLGDTISARGGAEAASVARVRSAWKKFRELSGLITNKEVSLRLKGKLYSSIIRSIMLYGSECWALKVDQEARLDRTEMRMVRWMSGVRLRERYTNSQLRERMGIEPLHEVLRRRRLRWLGHIWRKDDEEWVKKCVKWEANGGRGRGRPRLRWREVVERDMKDRGMVVEDAFDRQKWRMLSWGKPADPCLSGEQSR